MVKSTAIKLLNNTQLVKLCKVVNKLSSGDRQEAQKDLDTISAWAAGLAAYLGARGANGCGDNGHEDGVKEFNKTRRKVRGALGYGSTMDLRF